MQFNLRSMRDSDIPLITSSFMCSWVSNDLKRALKGSHLLPTADVLRAAWHSIIHKILDRSQVVVACALSDEDAILGYAVYDECAHNLYWMYVKDPYRKIGVGTSLARFATKSYSDFAPVGVFFTTKAGDKFLRKYSERNKISFESILSLEEVLGR